MVPSLTGSEADKRNARRLRIRLPGRYMLVDRSEWTCETIDISPSGIMLRGQARPYPGQTVVVYLAEIGRLEGTVARLKANEFALQIRATERKREQLAALLARLAEGEAPQRQVHPAILAAVGRQAAAPEPASAPVVARHPSASRITNPHGSFRVYLESL